MIQVSREAFQKLPKDLTFDALVSRIDGKAIQKREDLVYSGRLSETVTGCALMYRGAHGVVTGLACLHTQGW